MADKKLIVVTGATGAQGGGLVRSLLADKSGTFSIRALTRNPKSEKGQALSALGVDVVQADLDDEKSLQAAFDGAYGAFCVTNFREHFSVDKEMQQAHNMAEAAKAKGLKHVIWSTLEDTRNWVSLSDDRMPTLQEKYKVPHFDGKGASNAFFAELGVPTTYLNTSFYWDNFVYFGLGPKKGADGKWAITFPMGDKKLPGIAAEDIGKCAHGVFKQGTALAGETLGIAGGHLTGAEMAAALGKALDLDVHYNDVPPEVYRSFGFPGADDMGNMFQFKRDFNEYFCGARDIGRTRELNPELQTFAQWLAANAKRIPLE